MKIKELVVMMSKKVSDENYGSKGVTVGLTVDLEEGDDKDIEYAALSSWCAAKIGGTLKAHGALPSQTEPVGARTPQTTTQPQQDGPPKPVAKKPPVAQDAQQPTQPDDGVVKGPLTFVVETLSVEIKGGKRYVKAKGGNFKMYGVNVWPEVLEMPPLEWIADELDGADYPAPSGLTAIYIEKTLDGGKVVPDKVTGWV